MSLAVGRSLRPRQGWLVVATRASMWFVNGPANRRDASERSFGHCGWTFTAQPVSSRGLTSLAQESKDSCQKRTFSFNYFLVCATTLLLQDSHYPSPPFKTQIHLCSNVPTEDSRKRIVLPLMYKKTVFRCSCREICRCDPKRRHK